MSSEQLHRKLDLLINLLETLPHRLALEFQKREEIKKHKVPNDQVRDYIAKMKENK